MIMNKNFQSDQSILDVKDKTLTEWLELVFDPPENTLFCNWSFPTDELRDEYIGNIQNCSEEEVEALLLKFLMPSGRLGGDDLKLELLLHLKKTSRSDFDRLIKLHFYRRLLKNSIDPKSPPPWEGITWILDLLPHWPNKAIETLESYLYAHGQLLPDGRLDGLIDAMSIIRAKYIGTPTTQSEKIRLC